MIPLTLLEVAEAVAGQVATDRGDVVVTGVAADSRAVAPGDLFVAIPGERVDGHDFQQIARDAGAVAALSTREGELPTVVVDDPVAALGRLAQHVLGRLPDVDVVGVTGSSGKTTTKDLLGAVLALRGPVVAPEGSFNTEVGLPLTVLKCGPETRTLVLEMGARGVGHVEYLCRIARPRIGVVLNVGSAHLGEFGSRDAIATAKSELPAALPPDGVAVLNADDPLVAAMASTTPARVLTFGQSPTADVRIDDLELDDLARPSFVLAHDSHQAPVALRVAGEHNAVNAAAAAAAGLALGLPLPDIATALSAATAPSRWRMEVSESPAGVVVVNDAYNANPDSMSAALKALAEMGRQRGARTWAVLGEMRELGEDSATEHDAIGRLAVRLHIHRLIAVGDGARPVHLGAAHEGSWNGESAWVPDVAAAIRLVLAETEAGDVVLVKGSRAVGMEAVAEALLRDGQAA